MKLKIPPVIQVLIAAIAMWITSSALDSMIVELPAQLLIAAAFGAAGFTIVFIAVAMFVKAKTTVNPTNPLLAQKLVTTGLYRFSRNPMYLAMALLLAGWGVLLGSVLNVFWLAAFIQSMNILQIKPEEEALKEIFGDAYIDYCQRTRRWI